MNCIDNECRHLYTEGCESYCSITHKEVPDDIDITQCANFLQACTCINCTHANITIYETGTIDDIEYRCPLQGNKMIYDDSNPYCAHYADVPECNIKERWING